MDDIYLNKLKTAYALYSRFGIKFKTRDNRETVLSREPLNIEMHAKIAAEIKSTLVGGFPIGMLWLFAKNFRMVFFKEELRCFYYDETLRKCIPVKDGKEFLLLFVQFNTKEHKIFDDNFDFWQSTDNDLITSGKSTDKRYLTRARFFNKIYNYIHENQLSQFILHDYDIINEWGKYWLDFIQKHIEFCDDLKVAIRYKTLVVDFKDAFTRYCKLNNCDVTIGYRELCKEVRKYRRIVWKHKINPITGRKNITTARGFLGFRLKGDI